MVVGAQTALLYNFPYIDFRFCDYIKRLSGHRVIAIPSCLSFSFFYLPPTIISIVRESIFSYFPPAENPGERSVRKVLPRIRMSSDVSGKTVI